MCIASLSLLVFCLAGCLHGDIRQQDPVVNESKELHGVVQGEFCQAPSSGFFDEQVYSMMDCVESLGESAASACWKPESPVAVCHHSELAVAFLQEPGGTDRSSGEAEKALKALEEACKAKPDNSDLWDQLMMKSLELGNVFFQEGMNEPALTYYLKAHEAGTKLKELGVKTPPSIIWQVYCHQTVGKMYSHIGDHEKAVPFLQGAIGAKQGLMDQFGSHPQPLFEQGDLYRLLGESLIKTGKYEAAMEALGNAVNTGEKLFAGDPGVDGYADLLILSLSARGLAKGENSELDAALADMNQMFECRKKQAERQPDRFDFQWSQSRFALNIGNWLWRVGRIENGMKWYGDGRDLAREALRRFPDADEVQELIAEGSASVGACLDKLGRRKEAEHDFVVSVGIRERLFEKNPQDLNREFLFYSAKIRLGQLNGDLYELDRAEAMLLDGVRKMQQLLTRAPDNRQYQNQLTRSMYSLGWVYSRQGKDQEGYNLHEMSLQNCRKTLEQFPDDVDALDGYMATLKYMANWLTDRDVFDNAKIRWQEVIDLARSREEKEPQNPVFTAHRLRGQRGLASVERRAERLGPALEGFRAAVRSAREARAKYPDDRGLTMELAYCQAELADLLLFNPNSEEGMQMLNEAIATITSRLPAEPNMDDDLRYVLRLVESRGILLGRQGNHVEAIADYDFNLRYLSAEESQDTHVLRAVAMVRMGKVADGISAVDRVLEQSPKSGRTLYNIACVFAVAAAVDPDQKEEFASKSMEMLQNSLKHGFWDVDLMTKDPDLLFLRSRKDFAELVAAMRVRMGEEKKVGPIQ